MCIRDRPGEMVVFGSNYGAGYGHVAWVIEATLDYIIVYEQNCCLLYTSPSPRDMRRSRMPSSA
ncbi:hypothetical protein JMUB7530_27950 [Staphylococcus aureus]